jgi:hypothetical protein
LSLLIILVLATAGLAFAESQPQANDGMFQNLVTIVSIIVSFIVGYLLKRGSGILLDISRLLDSYQELGVIAIAVVSLIERKYAECNGEQQFKLACKELSKWSKGALTEEQIEQLVETAYSIAKKLFLDQWQNLRLVNGVDVRTPTDSAK